MYEIKEKPHQGITVADMFAGIGAFHKAFQSFGAKIVYACEWDKNASEIYEKNYGLKPDGDITKVNVKNIPSHDILCAGFPCQPFSISGKQSGFDDSRGTLFFEIAKIVQEKHPKIILLENVKNLLNHDGGRTFQVIYQTLTDLDYKVFYQVLNASDFDVPQKRERLFILAIRNDLENINFQFPTKRNIKRHLEDILLPNEETDEYVIHRDDIQLSGVTEYNCDKPLRIGIVNKGGQGERIYSPKGMSITLSAYGGGVGAKTGLYRINGKVRKLAPRECARLMGFPDDFIIHENKNTAYKQFGNSIVVDVIQSIIEEMVKQRIING